MTVRPLAGVLSASLAIGVSCGVPVARPAAPRFAPIPSSWKEPD